MTESTTVEAWFGGGPADGAIRDIEVDAAGQPPRLVAWRSGEVFVGSGDEPAPVSLATYELVGRDHAVAGWWVYRHAGTWADSGRTQPIRTGHGIEDLLAAGLLHSRRRRRRRVG